MACRPAAWRARIEGERLGSHGGVPPTRAAQARRLTEPPQASLSHDDLRKMHSHLKAPRFDLHGRLSETRRRPH
jgi:hypothetical protein